MESNDNTKLDNPKILVVSHNAFSLANNMGKTLYGLFRMFGKMNIAQLFFHILNPDVDVCKTAFRITDLDVLHSIILRNRCGRIVTEIDTGISSRQIINKIYQYGQKRTAAKHLIRDLIWKIGAWKSKDLISWLDSYNPDIVFFAAGYSMFAFDVAMFIANRYGIPLVAYFCDDYYDFAYNPYKFSPISSIRMLLFRRKLRRLVNQSRELVFISQPMMEKYNRLFGKTGHVIMTPYGLHQSERKERSVPLVMSFVGSVFGNRWKTLYEIGKALEEINCDGLKIILNIYSSVSDQGIISKLSIGDSVKFCGVANSELVKRIYHQSDIMLHVESFASEDVNRVMYSVSTKIPDCLASNRAFLAVGPSAIASISYLKANNAAYIIDDQSMIKAKLIEYFIENDIGEQLIRNAKQLADQNHDIRKNSQCLKAIFENAVKEC